MAKKSSFFNSKDYLEKQKERIDRHLEFFLPQASLFPGRISKAMRYAVLNGGKRIRAILTIESCLLYGGRFSQAVRHACAIEILHNYSLVHDDMPAMDNDSYRRGKLAVHRKYGEATALLVGDALLTSCFEIIASDKRSTVVREVTNIISQHAGYAGMIGGQAADLDYLRSKKPNEKILQYIHLNKTAKLISAALATGAVCANANKKDVNRIGKFGNLLGFVFQLIDDIMDDDGFAEIYGKKATFLQAEKLTEKAKKLLKPYGKKANRLLALTDNLLKRKN